MRNTHRRYPLRMKLDKRVILVWWRKSAGNSLLPCGQHSDLFAALNWITIVDVELANRTVRRFTVFGLDHYRYTLGLVRMRAHKKTIMLPVTLKHLIVGRFDDHQMNVNVLRKIFFRNYNGLKKILLFSFNVDCACDRKREMSIYVRFFPPPRLLKIIFKHLKYSKQFHFVDD